MARETFMTEMISPAMKQNNSFRRRKKRRMLIVVDKSDFGLRLGKEGGDWHVDLILLILIMP